MAQEIKQQPMDETTYINHVRKVLTEYKSHDPYDAIPTTMIMVVLQYMTYAYRMGVAWQKQQQKKIDNKKGMC